MLHCYFRGPLNKESEQYNCPIFAVFSLYNIVKSIPEPFPLDIPVNILRIRGEALGSYECVAMKQSK